MIDRNHQIALFLLLQLLRQLLQRLVIVTILQQTAINVWIQLVEPLLLGKAHEANLEPRMLQDFPRFDACKRPHPLVLLPQIAEDPGTTQLHEHFLGVLDSLVQLVVAEAGNVHIHLFKGKDHLLTTEARAQHRWEQQIAGENHKFVFRVVHVEGAAEARSTGYDLVLVVRLLHRSFFDIVHIIEVQDLQFYICQQNKLIKNADSEEQEKVKF